MRTDEGDNLLIRCQTWETLGGTELLDCAAHHRAFDHMKYHTRSGRMRVPIDGYSMRPPTQTTWRRLITLLLAFKDQRADNDAVGHYQCDEWGSRQGETCLAELSALAANSLSVERDRTAFRRERCKLLRTRLLENGPRFVVMYGLGARDSYEQIAGALFDSNGYVWADDTLCALVEHPVAIPGKPAAWWANKGTEIRTLTESQ